jgi:hypothetical protein
MKGKEMRGRCGAFPHSLVAKMAMRPVRKVVSRTSSPSSVPGDFGARRASARSLGVGV